MPGVGWVPVESTPGGASPVIYGGGAVTAADSAALEPTPAPVTPEPEESEQAIEDDMQVDQRRQNANDTAGEDESEGLFQAYWLVFVLLGILLLWLANYLWRWKWKRRFVSLDPNRAALCIYAFMKKLCKFGCDMPDEAECIAMKAQFSNHKIEEDELERMREELETCKKSLQKSQPGWKVWLLKLWGYIR